MSFKLLNRNGAFPAGGFKFKDPRTGMVFDQGDFYHVVRMIIAHRSANSRIYPTNEIEFLNFDMVSSELDCYTCSRIGNDPRFCESGEPLKLQPDEGAELVDLPSPCYKCGHLKGWQMICKTCHGKKVAGHICQGCNAPLGH